MTEWEQEQDPAETPGGQDTPSLGRSDKSTGSADSGELPGDSGELPGTSTTPTAPPITKPEDDDD